jgi:hypothetical protein
VSSLIREVALAPPHAASHADANAAMNSSRSAGPRRGLGA